MRKSSRRFAMCGVALPGSLALAFLILWGPSLAVTEIKDCGGILTNQDCAEGGQAFVPEKALRTPSPDAEERKRKQSILAELRSLAKKARTSEVVVDLGVTEKVCMMSTESECVELVLNKEKEINALVSSAKMLKETKTAVAALPSPTPIATGGNVSSNASVITVIQNNISGVQIDRRIGGATFITRPNEQPRQGTVPVLTGNSLPRPGVVQPKVPRGRPSSAAIRR